MKKPLNKSQLKTYPIDEEDGSKETSQGDKESANAAPKKLERLDSFEKAIEDVDKEKKSDI